MKTTIIIMICLLIIPLMGNKLIPLPDLLRPESMSLDDTQMYITEKANIYIYSLKDFKLIKKFGKSGSGPKEFQINAQAPLFCDSQSDKLIITSQLKVSFFSKKGKYIKEFRIAGLFASFFRSIRNKYAGTRLVIENNVMYFTVDIFDKDFKPGKHLFKQKHFFQQGKKMNPIGRLPFFSIHKDKIFIENYAGQIFVFDEKGNKTNTINHKYKPLLVTKQHKAQVINFYKTDQRIKQFWNIFKDNLEFPKYFPNIRQTILANDHIYIQTWRVVDNRSEFLIFTDDGKFERKTMVKLPDVDIMSPSQISIKNNKIYQLVENIDEEQWELNIIDIKKK